jgi:toluene monooxygenase system protein A
MPKLNRDDWIDLARKLDWDYSHVREEDVFPELLSGRPWLPHAEWQHWDEPYRTSYAEYVDTQADKDAIVQGVREAVGRVEDFAKLDRSWLNGLKLHAATMAFTEFAAGSGEIRAARFGRDSAWRTMALFGALDEFRHTQIPLLLMHELVRWAPQFDWTHRLFHTNNWMGIALRHLVDEMCLGTDPLEFAIATNVMLETGFTNLQFIGLSAMAHDVGDRMFEKMVTSIQTDEARHAQIGHPVLATLIRHDPERAQYLVDKWFWRSWIVFAVVTGFSMDYLTPLAARRTSFKEFMEEWITDQFQKTLTAFGLKRPWYWNFFIEALDTYHHMVYASAYTYRATMWFDFALPGPEERAWLREKYPHTWDLLTRWGDYRTLADRRARNRWSTRGQPARVLQSVPDHPVEWPLRAECCVVSTWAGNTSLLEPCARISRAAGSHGSQERRERMLAGKRPPRSSPPEHAER